MRSEDLLDEASLRAALDALPAPHRFGAVLEVHETLSSTNDRARVLLDEGAPDGTLVVADAQDSGRGRSGRPWFSPPRRNLYASLVLRPPLDPARAPILTLAAAVALAETFEREAGVRALVKWPNDLLVGPARALGASHIDTEPVLFPRLEKSPRGATISRSTRTEKCAGVLTEMCVGASGAAGVVCGIGVNVNLSHDELPAELRGRATSLAIASGRKIPRATLCAAIVAAFERELARLYVEGPAPMLAAYRARAAWTGRRVRFVRDRTVETAIVEDVDARGALVVVRDDGSRAALLAGEIELC
jgi:BirA family biotin operon repressor/biotin-[acetyl-CoA-carboxylase] ligase